MESRESGYPHRLAIAYAMGIAKKAKEQDRDLSA